ncbi:EAL domain-containing protein [Curvibacter sp. APW13]|uniref:EAL domain-containing protein n=1 Tax=Curvibacter sp. APW13 TaxID=3077236 RepID=UPI0028DF5195|nr:EAL domain-containing protein [Curvibacter sp. APW13]MDT8993004.1 EAL domain-containing protein [Curvibacter sp. APW13]
MPPRATATSPDTQHDPAPNPWRLALEHSGDGVWDWDMETDIQHRSARWWEMLGYDPASVPSSGPFSEFVDLVHPEDWPRILAAHEVNLGAPDSRVAVEFRMRCKDGRWKWILSRAGVVAWNRAGQAVRMIGTHTDVDEQHRASEALANANAALQRQHDHLHTTLASISQGVFLAGADGRIHTFNARLCEMLDVDPAWLAQHPTRQELGDFQHARGDFGPDYQLVEPSARQGVAQRNDADLPPRYVRRTPDGRTLEVQTHRLADGGLVRTYSDLSRYVREHAERERLDGMLTAVQHVSLVGCAESDYEHGTVYWTEGIYRILDADPDTYTPTLSSISAFLSPQAKSDLMETLHDPAQPTRQELEQELITLTGRRIWVRTLATMEWKGGRVAKRTSVMQDITEFKLAQASLRESEERWKLALESAGDGVWDWHLDTGHEYFSPRLVEMYGFEADELALHPDELDRRTHPDDLAQMRQDREDHFAGRTPSYHNEHRIQCRDGSWKWILSRGMVIRRDAQGKPLRMIGTHTDITVRKEAEAAIRHQAMFDALTGLPNRRMLRDRLEQEIKRCQRDNQQLAVLFMDLDHFKEINDTLGHDQGDVLLVEAARRIQGCLRASDTVARMGGDEFTVVLSEMEDATHLEGLLQKLLQALSTAFDLCGEARFVSASIGVTIYPLDGQDIEVLFKNADQALYAAKGAGRNRFSFFTPELQEAAQKRVRLAQDLRKALQNQEFMLVFQPIVHMGTGQVHKAEALIRWQHPAHGLVSPAEFIPVAESSGLIVEIGQWVFEQAVGQVQRWRAHLAPEFQISINKSPVQFLRPAPTCMEWGATMQAMELPGCALVIEITESLLLEQDNGVAEQLLSLVDAGIQISLDDFGTGYSSLSYLQRFDIDFIKIDQSFVRHLVRDSTDLALCKAIIAMAHALDIQVVAEGVETVEHFALLREAGCDYAQGYFFSRPMPAADFETWVRDYRPPSAPPPSR